MTKKELTQKLNQLNVSVNRYSIDSGMKADSLFLVNNHGLWQIYYIDERGGQNLLKQFIEEEDACNQLFILLTEDI